MFTIEYVKGFYDEVKTERITEYAAAVAVARCFAEQAYRDICIAAVCEQVEADAIYEHVYGEGATVVYGLDVPGDAPRAMVSVYDGDSEVPNCPWYD